MASLNNSKDTRLTEYPNGADQSSGSLSKSTSPTKLGDIKQSPHENGDEKLSTRNKLLLLEMLFLMLSVMATETTISPALPRIAEQYPEQQSWVPWTMAAYNVVGSVWTPIAGSLGDIFGVKWITLISLAIYIVGQVGCAFSRQIFLFIAFRAVQGVGMGIFVLCFTIIKKTFPPKYVPISMGVVSSMFSVGVSFGLVGGAAIIKLLKHTRWEYVFLVYLPIVVVLLIALYFTIPDVETDKSRRVDLVGAALLGVGVTAFLIGMTLSDTRGWTDGAVLGLVIAGAAIIAVFLVVECVVKDPMVDVGLLFTRDIATIGLIAFLVGFSVFAAYQVMPFMYQYKLGHTDPLIIGALLLPIVGGVMMAMMNVVSEHTTAEQFGSASGTNMLLRIFGSAVGPIVVNLILFKDAATIANPEDEHSPSATGGSSSEFASPTTLRIPTEEGYRNSFTAICAISAAAVLASQLLSGKFKACRRPRAQAPKGQEEKGDCEIGTLSVESVCDVEAPPRRD
eukprot:m51a1_g8184 hypothetical protein (509) ;mRNA; f:148388-150192